MLWTILSWIVVGGIAGWLASIITGRNNQQGCIMNIIVGVVGAALGGIVYNLIRGNGLSFNLDSLDITSIGGFLVALVGAVVLLLIVNWFQKR